MKIFVLCILYLLLTACSTVPHRIPSSKQKRLLVFGKSNRPAHMHIVPGAITHLVRHFQQNGFEAVGSQELISLTKESLSSFDGIVFVDVSNGILNDEHKNAVEEFVSQRKGLLLIHASIAAGNDWRWLKEMIGTSFLDHPPIQQAKVSLTTNDQHTVIRLPDVWSQSDEWYNFTSKIGDDFSILATVDESSYLGGKMGNHPITWSRKDLKQKVWFTAMGHEESLYAEYEAPFMKHILNAALWATSSFEQQGTTD